MLLGLRRNVIFLSSLSFLFIICVSCIEGIHPFDKTQIPVITVSSGLQPTISFSPSPSYLLRIYEGAEDKDGFDVYWETRNGDAYENDLVSPVTLSGAALIAGQTYTVTVERKDPLGTGEGFLNTRRKYVGKLSFVASVN